VSVDGHPYAVPLNMHIQNVLYYNQGWFDEQGLEPPKNFDELIFACQVFYEAGYTDYPMGLGTLGNWEASFVLDSILLELGGPEYYVSLYKGEIDVTTDATYREALERLAALYQYTNPDHPALWWDESLDRVVSGDSAMVIMGTWAIGALTSWGWTLGEDFDAVIFPQEPERILLFHPETYGLAVGAPHPDSTMKWLEVVASPDLQIPTDVTQGGLFARTDIDPTEFPDPFRQETQQFVRDNPESLILGQFGSIAPLDFSGEYWVIIADFMAESDPDINATIAAVASVFEAHAVRNQAAWYTWP
jgi:glucose/mannose transport system substrate-binding protein